MTQEEYNLYRMAEDKAIFSVYMGKNKGFLTGILL